MALYVSQCCASQHHKQKRAYAVATSVPKLLNVQRHVVALFEKTAAPSSHVAFGWILAETILLQRVDVADDVYANVIEDAQDAEYVDFFVHALRQQRAVVEFVTARIDEQPLPTVRIDEQPLPTVRIDEQPLPTARIDVRPLPIPSALGALNLALLFM